MPKPPEPPVNPHWREFFRCIRRMAEKLDALEAQQEKEAQAGGPR